MLLLALLAACTRGGDDDESPFLYPDHDAGAARATGQGFDFATPQLAVFAAQHVVPDLYWGISPTAEQATLIWETLQKENIADKGTCPALRADGPELYWMTNCRSQEGYDWSGEVSVLSWEDDGQSWEHWSYDIEVSSDLEDRDFDRIAITGDVWVGGPDGQGLIGHTQANLRIDTEGYWSRAFKDELDEAWQPYAVTGTWEAQESGSQTLLVFEGAADLGGYGGFGFGTRAGLIEGTGNCAGEPEGTVVLDALQEASLRYEGASRCDRCAQLSLDGEPQSLACDPRYF